MTGGFRRDTFGDCVAGSYDLVCGFCVFLWDWVRSDITCGSAVVLDWLTISNKLRGAVLAVWKGITVTLSWAHSIPVFLEKMTNLDLDLRNKSKNKNLKPIEKHYNSFSVSCPPLRTIPLSNRIKTKLSHRDIKNSSKIGFLLSESE